MPTVDRIRFVDADVLSYEGWPCRNHNDVILGISTIDLRNYTWIGTKPRNNEIRFFKKEFYFEKGHFKKTVEAYGGLQVLLREPEKVLVIIEEETEDAIS